VLLHHPQGRVTAQVVSRWPVTSEARPVHLRFVVQKVAPGRVNTEDGVEALKFVGVFIKYCNIYVLRRIERFSVYFDWYWFSKNDPILLICVNYFILYVLFQKTSTVGNPKSMYRSVTAFPVTLNM
jgi:hypothetical protein